MILQLTSYGNGVLLTKVLMAVSYIVSNSNYFVLLQIVAILAFFVAAITIHHANMQGGALGLKAMTILGIIGIVWSSFYLPQETVIIYDPVNNYQTSVRNVPIPVALPIYLENNIGDGISDLYDAFFATTTFPSSLEYNTTGYGWGPQAVSTLQHISFVKPYEQETITGYLSNCYITALLGGAANLNDLYTSNDLLKTIGAGANLSNSFGTTVYTSTDPGGTFMTCTQAYNGYIVPRITQTTTTGSTAQTFIATLDGKTEATGLTLPQMQNDLGSAGDYLLNTGLDSQQFIAQSAIANSLNPAMQQFAAKYGVSANNLSFGLAQTMYQQQTIWTQSALMARLFLPILHFIMEAIIFSTLPLIFLMSLIPGFGRKAFYFIMSAIMWLTFWSPLMSILNGLSDAIISWKGFPINVTGGNFNLDDMGYIFNNLHLWAAMIGSVSLGIPLFAYELASMSSFGGMMMASAVTGTLSGGVSSSAQATSTMSGAMGMQQQGQQMMQNQDNKAYDDHGYFDQMTNNNAAYGAANYASQAAADRMLGQGELTNDMLNNNMANLGGGAGYGSPNNAFQTGKLGSEQKVGTLEGLDNYAKSQGMSMQQISAINSQFSAFSTLNKERGTVSALGGPLTSAKVNVEQTGIDTLNSAKVNDMLKLYQQEGMTPAQAASNIAKTNGIAVAVQNGKETEIFGKDGKVAMTLGQTVQNGMVENWVKGANGQMIYTDNKGGSNTVDGYFTKNGQYTETYDGHKYIFGTTADGAAQSLNDYARQYMESKDSLSGEIGQYSNPERAIQTLDMAKTLAKEGQFKAAGAILKSFGMRPSDYKTQGAYSLPSVDNAVNSRIQAIEQSENNMKTASDGMTAATAAFYNLGENTGAPATNISQSFFDKTGAGLKEFYNTNLSTSVKNGTSGGTGSKSSTSNSSTFQQTYGLSMNFGKLIDPAGGLDIKAGGEYTHKNVYTQEQYSDFKKEWSNATTIEMRTSVLMKTYSEGLSNIDHMNVSAPEKAELRAGLLKGFYGAA